MDEVRGVGLHVEGEAVHVARHAPGGEVAISEEPAICATLEDEPLDGTPWAGRATRYGGHWLLWGRAAESTRMAAGPASGITTCGRFDLHRQESEFALQAILTQLLGRAVLAGEPCVFSVPAPAIAPARDFSFQRLVLTDMVRKLGYLPVPVAEGWAAALAALGSFEQPGLVLCCDDQQVHVCYSVRGGLAHRDLSLEPGGRWVDEQVAASLMLGLAEAQQLRRGCTSILVPRNRGEQAFALHALRFLDQLLGLLARDLAAAGGPITATPLRLVWAGSWLSPPDLGEAILRRARQLDFPLPLREAGCLPDPSLVARGCLVGTTLRGW